MNKIIQNTLIIIGVVLIVMIMGFVVLDNFKGSITVVAGICENLGGEIVSWNCSNHCIPSCQYPNGTEINMTKEIELVSWSR